MLTSFNMVRQQSKFEMSHAYKSAMSVGLRDSRNR